MIKKKKKEKSIISLVKSLCSLNLDYKIVQNVVRKKSQLYVINYFRKNSYFNLVQKN